MKRQVGGVTALWLLLFSLSPAQERGTLTVTGWAFKNNLGTARFALFNEAAGYPTKPEKAVRTFSAAIVNNQAKAVFDSLPFGSYAISLFHDENNNGKLDFRLFIPREGTGATNDAKGFMGPPKFSDAAFSMDRPTKSLMVQLNY